MRRYQKSEGAGVEKEEEVCGWVLPPGRYYLQPQAMISLVMMATPDFIVRWESGLLREHLTLFTSPFRVFQYKFVFSVRTERRWCWFDRRIVVRWSCFLHLMLIPRLQNAKCELEEPFCCHWNNLEAFLRNMKFQCKILNFKSMKSICYATEQRLYPFYYHQPFFIQWSLPHLQWQQV